MLRGSGVASQITFLTAAGLSLALSGCVVMVPLGPGPGGEAARAASARPWPAAATCPTPPGTASDAARVLTLVNAERAHAGLGPLRAAPALGDAAQRFACELAARGQIGHRGSDGSSLSERLARQGFASSLVSENVAAGQDSPEEVVAAWMASPHHRENILRPSLTLLGLGRAGGDQPYWVLDLAS